GESAVDEAIAPIYKTYENVQTSILFNKTEIELQLMVRADAEAKAENILDELAGKIKEKLGLAVFAMNGEMMEEIIGKLLSAAGKTLSVAESCTGGLISERLTEIAGASEYFIEGATVYANEAKIRTLNVAPEIIENNGAVSAETAEAMAEGMRKKSQTDYAISVTGIAGPTGGSEEKPIGLVYVGFASKVETKAIKIMLPGDRHLIRWRASQAALDLLRRKMLKSFSANLP
ncbi:MAG: nicotinamide-nucleotide amidohydrolase family protein, partial [Acidobacteria bacterium]|nr:nicotinamide-nucleotide amidohydrolase family protein [Acidobacteriota bacterium]